MTKLYYSPGACSLSPHIVLRETGMPFQLVMASTKTKKLADGTDFYAINPKGQVPLLELDDGQRLSFIDYKVSQVSQWPVRSTPLGILLDPKADLAKVARVLPDSESPLLGQVAVLHRGDG
jgi:glutathione S-transferase